MSAAASSSQAEPLLRVEDLRVEFPGEDGVVHAVDGISYEVQRGRTLGIVGESGSGKTVSSLTTLGLTRRQGARISGRILFDGQDLVTLPEARLRAIRGNEIAMIFQDPLSALHPLYRVGAQLIEAVLAHQDISKRRARERAIELLGLVGIPDPARRVDEYPHEFSGGMRQRAMIAMALVNEPKLLIADEPTTALDVTVQAQILALLERLQRELRMAIVIITHDLGVVAEMADEIAVMYAGRIVRDGVRDGIVLGPGASVHMGPVEVDPDNPRFARGGPHADPWKPTQPDHPAVRMSFPHALPLCAARPRPHRPQARAAAGRAGAPGRLSAPGGRPPAPVAGAARRAHAGAGAGRGGDPRGVGLGMTRQA